MGDRNPKFTRNVLIKRFFCHPNIYFGPSIFSDFVYSGGWNTEGVWNSNGSLLLGYPMAFGFLMMFCFEQMAAILSKTIGNPNKMATILFRLPMVWFKKGQVHSYSYSYNRPFQNRTIGNLNFKTFSILMSLVF